MDKIEFKLDDEESVEFYILEQTRINGQTYLLVTDSEEDEAECLIMREVGETVEDSTYEIVEDDNELEALLKVFEELLEDVSIN